MRADVALERLKIVSRKITKQQYKTLKGQILSGDIDGAMRGLQKILIRGEAR